MSFSVKIDRIIQLPSAPEPGICAACGRQVRYCAPCAQAWVMIEPDVFIHIIRLCQSCGMQANDQLPERICELAVRQIQCQPPGLLTHFERDLQRAIINQTAVS